MPSILVQIVMSATANTHGSSTRPGNTLAVCYRVADDDDYRRRKVSRCVNEVAAIAVRPTAVNASDISISLLFSLFLSLLICRSLFLSFPQSHLRYPKLHHQKRNEYDNERDVIVNIHTSR